MIEFNKLFGCALSVAVTAGFAVDVLASEFTRERAASAMYGKTPAEQRIMLSERAAVTAAPPWFRMPPQAWTPSGRYLPRSDFAGRAGYPVWPVSARASRQHTAPARYQRPVPAPAFNRPPVPWNTAANAQYRPPMPPPVPMWVRAPRPPVNLARYQRPVSAPDFNRRPVTRNTDARFAQYRPPMPPPAPMWAHAPRPPVNLARYQRPVPAPAFNRPPVPWNTAANAQYRPPMPPPAPMWARVPRPPVNLARYQRPLPAPAFDRRQATRVAQYRPLTPSAAPMWARQSTVSASSPADTHKLQAQQGESDSMGKAGDTAELAAFESSRSETPVPQAQKSESDDSGQAIESSKVDELVVEVPPLLARPTWMNKVPEGS